MAVTQRRRQVVNSARKNAGRRKLSPAQKAAGFGGKRAKAAVTKPRRKRHKPAARKNGNAITYRTMNATDRARAKSLAEHRRQARAKHKAKSNSGHRRRAPKKAARRNTGKILSFELPKELGGMATTTKKNRRKSKANSGRHRASRKNTGHRRRSTRRNPSMGGLTDLVTSSVFVIAGAVGSKYLTQTVLTTSNTGIMGYLGNLVSAFLLSWGVKAFMKNDKAAAAVLSGGVVQVVLRLIADYTPFGQYTANLGMGDYMVQDFRVPQRMANGMRSAVITTSPTMGMTTMGGMSGCGDSLYGGNGQYS